mmetsp:Transcript_17734/g.41257  ORF Transcript_17734/g.41257 Transcript_17734/m.41257 type:complete len:851 (+) Transcript_17734:105-2657(+)
MATVAPQRMAGSAFAYPRSPGPSSRRPLAAGSAAAGDGAAAWHTLQRLRRAILASKEKLAGAVGRPGSLESMVQQVKEAMRGLDAEVKAAVEQEISGAQDSRIPSLSPTRSSSVLRQSLAEADRRCDNLNKDLARQKEVGEELTQALSTAKSNNQRLLQQLKAQDDDLERLAAQRSTDAERYESLTKRCQTELDLLEQESKRRLSATKEAAASQKKQIMQELSGKLRYIQTQLLLAEQDVRGVKEAQKSGGVKDLLKTLEQQLTGAEAALLQEVSAYSKEACLKETRSKEVLDTLTSELHKEVSLRRKEATERMRRQTILSLEREEIQRHADRDRRLLSSHLRAVESSVHAAKQEEQEEKGKREKDAIAREERGEEWQNILDQLQEEAMALEAAHLNEKQAIRLREDDLVQLQKKARVSDDAVAAALFHNDHLRVQMAEESERLEAVNSTNAEILSSDHEQKLFQTRRLHEGLVTGLRERIETLESKRADSAAEVAKQQAHRESVEQGFALLEQHINSWKSKYESATKARRELEGQVAAGKKAFACERLALQAFIDTIGPENIALEEEVGKLTDAFTSAKREAIGTEAELTSRISTLEDALKDTQSRLAEARGRLTLASEASERLLTEAEADRRQSAEVRNNLQRELSQTKQEVTEEIRDLEVQLQNERSRAKRARELCEEIRDAHEEKLRRLQDDCATRIGMMEREKAKMEDQYAADMVQLERALAQQHGQLEALESSATHLRSLLADSQANLAWVKQERERDEGKMNARSQQLQDDLQRTYAAIVEAQRSEASLKSELDLAATRVEHANSKLSAEVSDARLRASREDEEARIQLTRLQSELEATRMTL